MNKKSFSRELSIKLDTPLKNTDIFINAFLDQIKTSLKTNNKITINNFGTFKVKVKKSHYAINPNTKEKIVVPEKKVVVFRLSENIKNCFSTNE